MGLTARNLKGLFLAHGRELEDYLSRRVRCAHTAADLTQEAFLRLAQQREQVVVVEARAVSSANNCEAAIAPKPTPHSFKNQRRESDVPIGFIRSNLLILG